MPLYVCSVLCSEYICQLFAFSQIVLLYLKKTNQSATGVLFGWAFSYFLPVSKQEDSGLGLFRCSFLLCVCSGGGGQNGLPLQSALKMSAPLPSLQSPPPSVSRFFFPSSISAARLIEVDPPRLGGWGGGDAVKSRSRGGNEGCQKKPWRGSRGSSFPACLCASARSSATLSPEV